MPYPTHTYYPSLLLLTAVNMSPNPEPLYYISLLSLINYYKVLYLLKSQTYFFAS